MANIPKQPTNQLSDNEIAVRVMPTSARWPGADTARTIAWDRLRDARDLLRALVKTVDRYCVEAEFDTDLSAEGIARRRAEHGRKALSELERWPPFIAAEKATQKNIEDLEARMTALPPPPKDATEITLALAVCQHVKAQKLPASFVLDAVGDARVLQAVLHLPRFLTGLSEDELGAIREKARRALHPEQANMQDELRKALDDVRSGVAATQRLLRERCKIPALTLETNEPAA